VARRALLLHRIDFRPILTEIRQPVLVVSGDCDPLVNHECAAVLRDGLPGAEHVELDECGHFPQYTHPEVLAEVVARFLTPPPCLT